jgi:hypothetical protein
LFKKGRAFVQLKQRNFKILAATSSNSVLLQVTVGVAADFSGGRERT